MPYQPPTVATTDVAVTTARVRDPLFMLVIGSRGVSVLVQDLRVAAGIVAAASHGWG